MSTTRGRTTVSASSWPTISPATRPDETLCLASRPTTCGNGGNDEVVPPWPNNGLTLMRWPPFATFIQKTLNASMPLSGPWRDSLPFPVLVGDWVPRTADLRRRPLDRRRVLRPRGAAGRVAPPTVRPARAGGRAGREGSHVALRRRRPRPPPAMSNRLVIVPVTFRQACQF